MSAHKVEYKHKTILDLTDRKINYQKMYLRIGDLEISAYQSKYRFIPISNDIKIGKYIVSVVADINQYRKAAIKDLAFSDRLKVSILESKNGQLNQLKLNLIEGEPWYKNYLKNVISLNDLTNIIVFCDRLDGLYSFS